jgi:hypothetical protein
MNLNWSHFGKIEKISIAPCNTYCCSKSSVLWPLSCAHSHIEKIGIDKNSSTMTLWTTKTQIDSSFDQFLYSFWACSDSKAINHKLRYGALKAPDRTEIFFFFHIKC